MDGMFWNAQSLTRYIGLGCLNVSDMFKMFLDAHSFNQDISNWNIMNVVNMDEMFGGTQSLDDYYKCLIHLSFSSNENWPYDWSDLCTFTPLTKQELQTAVDLWVDENAAALETYGEINTWDVRFITDMSDLFRDRTTFNDDISNWDVSNVTNMSYLFFNAHQFYQDLSIWDVSNVTNMTAMFQDANSFNSDISDWDVSNVTNMTAMFKAAYSFDRDLSTWNVSNVVSMNGMFEAAESFNQDLSEWNVSNTTSMSYMFGGAISFNQSLSNWDVSNVESMNYMFNDCGNFNGDISNWDVTSVLNMSNIFLNATSFDQDLSNWDVSNLIGMSSMFESAESFNQDLSEWNVSGALYMDNMFDNTLLSEENKCAIHNSFSSNAIWPYEWSESCNLKSQIGIVAPENFSLHQNFPNPFNPITTVRYELPEDSFVDVTVYDMLGNVISNLINTNQSSGYKSIQWNATNNQGEPVSAGFIYKDSGRRLC